MGLDKVYQKLIKLCGPSQLPAASELQSEFDELSNAINQLIKLEDNFAYIAVNDTERLRLVEELQQIVACAGGFIDGVKFSSFPGEGIGIAAVKNFKAGDLVMKIPRSAMLTHEDALACPAWAHHLASDPMCNRMPNACLALYLLHHWCHGSASQHASYIRCLPSSFTNCLSFDSRAFHCLATVEARERVLAEWRNATRQYLYFSRVLSQLRLLPNEKLQLPLAEPGRFTFAAYRWAVSAVMSRNNAVPSAPTASAAAGESANTLALIPLWDMGNHKFGQISTDYSLEEQCLMFYAMEDVSSDNQMYFMYGARSTTDFLLYSGFLVPHEENPHDTADLRLGLNPKDKLIEQKQKCLESLGINKSQCFHVPVSSPFTEEALLTFTRVMCAQTAEEVATAASTGSGELNKRAGVYLANRCRILSLVQAASRDSSSSCADSQASVCAALCTSFAAGERTKFARLAAAFQTWADQLN